MERRYGRDAILTRANILTLGHIFFSLDLVKDILKDSNRSWKLVPKHIAVSALDGIDGPIARNEGPTELGERLDPLADKTQVLGELIALAVRQRVSWVPVAVIGLRELFVTKYRSSLYKEGIASPATPLGKRKTHVQLGSIGVALIPPLSRKRKLVDGLTWGAAGITVVSGAEIYINGKRARRENAKMANKI